MSLFFIKRSIDINDIKQKKISTFVKLFSTLRLAHEIKASECFAKARVKIILPGVETLVYPYLILMGGLQMEFDSKAGCGISFHLRPSSGIMISS